MWYGQRCEVSVYVALIYTRFVQPNRRRALLDDKLLRPSAERLELGRAVVLPRVGDEGVTRAELRWRRLGVKPRVLVREQVGLRQRVERQHAEARRRTLQDQVGAAAADENRDRRRLLALVCVCAEVTENAKDAAAIGWRSNQRAEQEDDAGRQEGSKGICLCVA